jgi:Tfp pilus assembly protein PilO
MEENKLPNEEQSPKTQPEIIVNNYGATRDDAVVIEEADRTVLLTEDETIIIEKPLPVSVVPKNRPRRIYAGMWGQVEIATVGVALLAVLTTILLFVFIVLPAQKELDANRAKRDELERQMISARDKYGSITSTEERVAELIQSVTNFEDENLFNSSIGKTALYQRINGLIASYGLTNTTGPDYQPLEIDLRQNTGENEQTQTGKDKYRSIFPGEYVTMTVEGSYHNLRRFIREIETSKQFVVISAVELEPTETKEQNQQNAPQQAALPNQPMMQNQPVMTQGYPNQRVNPNQFDRPGMIQQPQQQTAAPVQPRGKTHGETVSLRLELAAYFRRPNVSLPETSAQ